MHKKFSLLFALFFIQNVFSADNPTIIQNYNIKTYDHEIISLYTTILKNNSSPVEKIEKISHYFVGRKYLCGALGEGCEADIDKSPLYRTDAFDCATFVSTVLAIAESNNHSEFVKNFKKIQYKNSHVAYLNRYHFIELDWNFANEKYHFLEDITRRVSPRIKMANEVIDQPNWFKHHQSETLKYFSVLPDVKVKYLLATLHQYSQDVRVRKVATTYIPLTELFSYDNNKLKPNNEVFDRIPSGTIVEIVDKTKHFKNKIGTDINIVHLGFAIRNSKELLFRHASKVHQEVVDVPLTQYLNRFYLLSNEPEKIGIHLEKVL